MQDGFLLSIHLIHLMIRLLQPVGLKASATVNLLIKKQLLVIQPTRARAPNLTILVRLSFGRLAMMLSPKWMVRSAIIIKPSTLLSIRKTLVRKSIFNSFVPMGIESRDPKALIVI
jgi:putative transposase